MNKTLKLVSLSTIYLISTSSKSLYSDNGEIALNPKEFKTFSINKITKVGRNTKSYDIKLPDPNSHTGLKTASCLLVKGPLDANGKPTFRPYTPTSLNSEKGHFELVIKSYPTGVVSKYLDTLKVGDTIEVKGPIPKFTYVANSKKRIGLIAGGSGITPMIQVIKEILSNTSDKTEIDLLYSNTSEDDVIYKDQLDQLAKHHKNLKITYVISSKQGRISKSTIEKVLPSKSYLSPDSLILVCGPPSFMESISGSKTPDYKQGLVGGYLKEIGFNEDQVFKF